jgi:hypothetical protein
MQPVKSVPVSQMNVRSKTADRALDTPPDTQGTEMLQGKPQVSPLTFTGTKQECVKVLRPLDMAAFPLTTNLRDS